MQTLMPYHLQHRQLIKRFTAMSYSWELWRDIPSHLVVRALEQWVLECSSFKPSEITYAYDFPLRWSIDDMARGKKADQKQPDNTWKGFVNIRLSDDEWLVIDGLTPTLDLGEYVKWLADFGKVSISFNPQNSTYNATVVFAGGRLSGYGISSFSQDYREAISALAFKIENYHDTVDLTGATGGKAVRG